MHVIEWIKSNKLLSVLLLVIVYLFWSSSNGYAPLEGINFSKQSNLGLGSSEIYYAEDAAYRVGSSYGGAFEPIYDEVAPNSITTERLVVKTGYLSIVVDEVEETRTSVLAYAETLGGYLVSSEVNSPTELPYGTLTVRIPNDEFEAFNDFVKKAGIKTVMERVSGRDVTDEYIDIDERLAILNELKTKFEEIRDKAVEITDLVTVQRELMNVQEQIDDLKGRQKYIEQSAELSKITIYFATDELELPYAPSDSFRPSLIFKTAVRALNQTLGDFGAKIIWAAVYSIIWVPLLLITFLGYRFIKKKYS